MLPGEMGHLAFPRDEVAYFVPTKRLHSVEWARAASGSRKAVCCGGVLLSHTLPGAVPSALAGLASRFGMEAGRFPAAMTTTR